jgi:hypothetical protein
MRLISRYHAPTLDLVMPPEVPNSITSFRCSGRAFFTSYHGLTALITNIHYRNFEPSQQVLDISFLDSHRRSLAPPIASRPIRHFTPCHRCPKYRGWVINTDYYFARRRDASVSVLNIAGRASFIRHCSSIVIFNRLRAIGAAVDFDGYYINYHYMHSITTVHDIRLDTRRAGEFQSRRRLKPGRSARATISLTGYEFTTTPSPSLARGAKNRYLTN